MSNKQTTAMQEMQQWVDDNYPNFNKADIENKINELLTKERDQMRNSFWAGDDALFHGLARNEIKSFDQYFTQTFKQD